MNVSNCLKVLRGKFCKDALCIMPIERSSRGERQRRIECGESNTMTMQQGLAVEYSRETDNTVNDVRKVMYDILILKESNGQDIGSVHHKGLKDQVKLT